MAGPLVFTTGIHNFILLAIASFRIGEPSILFFKTIFFKYFFRHFKEDDARTVIQLMQRHPEKRRDILKHLASNVSPLITKGCYNHSLVHTVLYNYMIGLNHQMEAMPSENERRGKERSEFIASLR